MNKYAHISIHVESHEKFSNPHDGHRAFSKLLSDPSLPPMGLFWLRNKDEEKCHSNCQFDLIHPKHEIGLHFHTVTDYQDTEKLFKAIVKEKELLQDRIKKPINSFSAGHFGLNQDGLEVIAEAGFEMDFSVSPGLVMISAKGSPCSYRSNLPQSFWISLKSDKKILEFSLTTKEDQGVLDILVNPLSKIYDLLKHAIHQPPGFIHITAHSYDFMQSDLLISKKLEFFKSFVSLLQRMGYQFITQSQLFEQFSKSSLPIISSDKIFSTKQIEKL